MHCHIFSEGVTVADACPCRATLPLQVLSLDADGGEWEKLVAAANLSVTIYNDVRMQPVRLAKGDVPADDTVRTDFTIVANGCIGMNDCAGMNLGHGVRLDGHSLPMREKVMSASLTTSPPTVQTPRALATLLRALSSSISICNTSPGLTGLRHFTFSADMK